MSTRSKRVVDAFLRENTGGKEVSLHDDKIPGFGIRKKPSGAMSWFVRYRNENGRPRRMVLGRVGVLTPEQARDMAQNLLAAARKGDDPSAERKAARKAITVAELCDERDGHLAVVVVGAKIAAGRILGHVPSSSNSVAMCNFWPKLAGFRGRRSDRGHIARGCGNSAADSPIGCVRRLKYIAKP